MATVRIVVHGKGCVHLWPNKGSVCSTTKDVQYELGERADFRASPDAGWKFEKFCNGETPPYCIPDWAFQWNIDIPYGEVHAYFTASPETLIEAERKDREAADQKLGDRIAALEKWAGTQIMEVLASIQDIVERSEQEAAAWRAGLLDLEGRIKAWIEEQIIAILLRALDREVEKVK